MGKKDHKSDPYVSCAVFVKSCKETETEIKHKVTY